MFAPCLEPTRARSDAGVQANARGRIADQLCRAATWSGNLITEIGGTEPVANRQAGRGAQIRCNFLPNRRQRIAPRVTSTGGGNRSITFGIRLGSRNRYTSIGDAGLVNHVA